MTAERRQQALLLAVADKYDADRALHVEQLLVALRTSGVERVDRYLSKLAQAVGQPHEFRGILREGVYARELAEAGGAVTIEPRGDAGPDLAVLVGGSTANVEVKRLTEGEGGHSHGDDVAEWFADQVDPESRPGRREWVTSKVIGVIRAANGQLVDGELNAVFLSDWSITIARQNFLHAVEDLEHEISANGTYGRVNIVRYDANFMASQMPQTSFVWVNPHPAVPLPETVRSFFVSVGDEHSRKRIAEIERFMAE